MNYAETMKRFKTLLLKAESKKAKKKIEKLTDNEISKIIGHDKSFLAVRNARKSIPYETIIKYCLKNKISLDKIFSFDDLEMATNI